METSPKTPSELRPLVPLNPPAENLPVGLNDMPSAVGVDKLTYTDSTAEFQVGSTTYSCLGKTERGDLEFQSRDADGIIRPLVVYRSNTGGSYRVSQGYEIYDEKPRLMKGAELSQNSQYTQDTQLHPDFDEMVGRVEESKQLRVLPVREKVHFNEQDAETLMRDFESQMEVYELGDSPQLHDMLHKLGANAFSKANIETLQEGSLGNTDATGKELTQYVQQLNELLKASGIMPNFSDQPQKIIATDGPMGKHTVIEVFSKTYNGVTYEWNMAHDLEGRAWIDRIRFADAEPSVYGTDKQVVYSGILTSKPLDYKAQAEGVPATMQHDMDGSFTDISEFLNTIAPIAEYGRHYSKRNHLVRFVDVA